MVKFYLFSDKGERDHNEDSVGMYQKGQSYCFILADGLGGHGKGEVASALAVETAVKTFTSEETEEEGYIEAAFRNAQRDIILKQDSGQGTGDMKTTMTVLQIGEEQIRWGHIGDSRLYYFQNKKLIERTLDHSVPQILVASGEIKEKQIRHHPDRNRLLKVLGNRGEEIRCRPEGEIRIEKGQAFLLCSDGFWEWIPEKKMIACLKKAVSPQSWAELMTQLIWKNGKGKSMDNFSAIAVWIE